MSWLMWLLLEPALAVGWCRVLLPFAVTFWLPAECTAAAGSRYAAGLQGPQKHLKTMQQLSLPVPGLQVSTSNLSNQNPSHRASPVSQGLNPDHA